MTRADESCPLLRTLHQILHWLFQSSKMYVKIFRYTRDFRVRNSGFQIVCLKDMHACFYTLFKVLSPVSGSQKEFIILWALAAPPISLFIRFIINIRHCFVMGAYGAKFVLYLCLYTKVFVSCF